MTRGERVELPASKQGSSRLLDAPSLFSVMTWNREWY